MRIYQILTIIKSIVNSLEESGPSLVYLPLLPYVLYSIVANQLNHNYYVSRTVWDMEYDYVVIGAGSAGSVMAARLSENSNVSVLLLEAGLTENIVSDVPLAATLLQRTFMDWSFVTEPQKKACFAMKGRRSFWARGKVMGGSSTINTMNYIRGNSRDYDNWVKNGATGWSWSEVFPYFIKAEDNRDPRYVATGYHGVGGPLTVSTSTAPRKVSFAFEESGPHLNTPIGDPNGENQITFTIPQRTIRDGMRCSVAKAYLEPLGHRKNLHILIKSLVTKILFDDKKRAVGVEFERLAKKYRVYVRKEVILSAGTINSPKLLMLSGVGPKEHLSKFGIPVISDLRVGDNLQEHYYTGMSFTVNESIGISVLNEIAPWHLFEYFLFKKNTLSDNLGEGIAYYKTKYANKSDNYPDVQLLMIPGTLSTDFGISQRYTQGMLGSVWHAVYKNYTGLNTFSIYPMTLRPYSRGHIRLKSVDPKEPPLIEPNIFDKDQDLNILIEGMKFALNISQTPAFQRYNAQPFQTRFPGCKHLVLYSQPYLRCMARSYTFICWHPAGTNKMGAISDPSSVVDSHLRVKGVNSLRVVDASIMPTIVSGNLNAPIVMIAEKIADIMKGIRLVPFLPPMSPSMVKRLPYLEYEALGQQNL